MIDTRVSLLDNNLIGGYVCPFGSRRVLLEPDCGYTDQDSEIVLPIEGAPVHVIDDATIEDTMIGDVLEFQRRPEGVYAICELASEHPDTPYVLEAIARGRIFFCCQQQPGWQMIKSAIDDPLSGYITRVEIGVLRLVRWPNYVPSHHTAESYLAVARAAERAVPDDWQVLAQLAERPVRTPGTPLPPKVVELVQGMAEMTADIPVALAGQSRIPLDGSAVIAWDTNNAKLVITRNFIVASSPICTEITPNIGQQASRWSHTFDFTLSDGGWVPVSGATSGVWALGSGWADGTAEVDGTGHYHRHVNLQLAFTAQITSVAFTYNMNKGFFSDNDPPLIIAKQGFSFLNSILPAALSSGDGQIFSWSGDEAVTLLQIRCESSFANTSGALTGSCSVLSCTITGTGPNPFGGAGTTITHVNQAVFDPVPSAAGKYGIYCLCDDNTSSFVFFAPDAFANPPQWSVGAAVTGLYKSLKLTKTKGTLLIESPASGGNVLVCISANYGATWAGPIGAGASPGSSNGMDTMPLYGSEVSYTSKSGGQVVKASSIGGAYVNHGAALADIVYVFASWYVWGSNTTKASAANPPYIIGLSALSGGQSVILDNGSASRTDVTPTIAAVKGLVNGPNFATGYYGKKWAIVAQFSGVTHLLTAADISTGTWTDRGVQTGCTFVLVRRRNNTANPAQLYWNLASGRMGYSKNFGVSSVSKQLALVSCDGFDALG